MGKTTQGDTLGPNGEVQKGGWGREKKKRAGMCNEQLGSAPLLLFSS